MRTRRTGFTLLEIMMALGVLAVAFLPIFRMLTSGGAATREQKAEGVAANLAKEKMNWLMVVATQANLEEFESAEKTLVTETIEGNEYLVSAHTSKLTDSAVSVVYPEFTWHDIRGCSGGIEATSLSTGFTEETKKISEVVKDSATGFHLMDVFLRVKWKLPNEAAYKDKNQLILVSRRAFL